MKGLSKTEIMIMKSIWHMDGEITAVKVLEDLHTNFNLEIDKKTLGTLLYRLETKGYLQSKPRGRRNYYTFLISEKEMKKREIKNMLFWWFENSVPDLVSTLSDVEGDLEWSEKDTEDNE